MISELWSQPTTVLMAFSEESRARRARPLTRAAGVFCTPGVALESFFFNFREALLSFSLSLLLSASGKHSFQVTNFDDPYSQCMCVCIVLLLVYIDYTL